MPFWVSVASLTYLFIAVVVYLINARQLLPSMILFFSFILFVLWLTGLIKISIELWAPQGVNTQCTNYVTNNAFSGQSVNTLAWLEQSSICEWHCGVSVCSTRAGSNKLSLGQSWKAAFSFALIGTIFFLWMMVISYAVLQGDPP